MAQPLDIRTAIGLAIETSGSWGSVALGRGRELIEARGLPTLKRHAAELLPTIDRLCRDQGVAPNAIEVVFVSAGPGSFTGLRIGITVARMLALGAGARLVAVPTLEAVAQNARDVDPQPARLAVLLDARRRRVYAQSFACQGERYQPRDEPGERDPAAYLGSLATGDHTRAVVGEGTAVHRQAVEAAGWPVLPPELDAPRAEVILHLGWDLARAGCFADPHQLVPTYIRLPEPEEKWQQRSAT